MAKKTADQRNWTVMVYLAGDNNLDTAGMVNLKEMKTAGTTAKIAVLAQFDPAGAKRATVRYCLKKGTTLAKDACLMSMAEVAFQMRDVADYSVGSEETEPGDGWPYDRILKALVGKPEMTPEELSESIVNSYLASYKAGDNVTQSALKLASLKPLTVSVDGLAKALKNVLKDAPSRSALVNARSQVQEYSRPSTRHPGLHQKERLGRVSDGVSGGNGAVMQAGDTTLSGRNYGRWKFGSNSGSFIVS